jgi:hypothetical protein
MEEKTELEKEIEGIVRAYKAAFGGYHMDVFEKTVRVELPCIALDTPPFDAESVQPKS